MVIYENDDIYVRPLCEKDLEKLEYIKWFHDQEVCKYNSHGKMSHMLRPKDITKIDPKSNIVWAVFKKDFRENSRKNGKIERSPAYDTHIGNVCLNNIDWINRNAEFTCIFGEKEYWGKGYCTQAMRMLLNHGFNKLNLDKIWLGVAEENTGMIKAAGNVGMVEEGRLKGHVFVGGVFEDVIRLCTFKGDFNNEQL